MKWSKNELFQNADSVLTFEEEIVYEAALFKNLDRLSKILDVTVIGEGRFDSSAQRFVVDFTIFATVVVPCAITLEDVIVPLEIKATEVFTFEKSDDEDVHVVKGEMVELFEIVFQTILMETPIKVVKPGLIEYPKGEGWEVMKEEDYKKSKEKTIDPRLAKLKEYIPQ